MTETKSEFKLPKSEAQMEDLVKENTRLKIRDLKYQIQLNNINIENLNTQKKRLDNEVLMQKQLITQNKNNILTLENSLGETVEIDG